MLYRIHLSPMPTQIQDLPDELLASTLEYLPKPHLKSARLACVRWSNIGAEMLVSSVYFAPRQDVMETFCNITTHSIFSKTIKEIIYDGRLYLSRNAADPNVFRRKYKGKICSSNDEEEEEAEETLGTGPTMNLSPECLTAYRVYQQLFCEQENIMRNDLDIQALEDGLTRMPNLTTVRLLDTFVLADWLPIDDHSHESYMSRRPCRFHAFTLPPSEWDDRHDDPAPTFRQWDCRGITSFFCLLSTHCSQVSNVQIGCQKSNTTWKFLDSTSVMMSYLQLIARNLKSLKLHCARNSEMEPALMDDTVSDIASIIDSALELEILSITGMLSMEAVFAPEFGRLHLTVLDLGDTNHVLNHMLAVMEGSRVTLRRLQLRNVALMDDNTWQDLGDNCGRCFQLHRVVLLGLNIKSSIARTGNRTLGYEGTVDVAKRMLQWVDSRALHIEPVEDLETAVDVRVDIERLAVFKR